MTTLYIFIGVALLCSVLSIIISISAVIEIRRMRTRMGYKGFEKQVNNEYYAGAIDSLDETQKKMAEVHWDHETNIKQLIRRVRIISDILLLPNKDV